MVTHEGFRWVTQIDPLWNAYFLGLVFKCHLKLSKQDCRSTRKRYFHIA